MRSCCVDGRAERKGEEQQQLRGRVECFFLLFFSDSFPFLFSLLFSPCNEKQKQAKCVVFSQFRFTKEKEREKSHFSTSGTAASACSNSCSNPSAALFVLPETWSFFSPSPPSPEEDSQAHTCECER